MPEPESPASSEPEPEPGPEPEPEPEAIEASPLVVLRLRLGLNADADPWLRRYLDVWEPFDAGDNRRASQGLRALLTEDLPAPLRQEALRLQARLRPDPMALLVAGASALLLIAIWIAAVSAG